MLREERATKATHDPAKDTLTLEIEPGSPGSKGVPAALNVLVGADGHLVGIDVGDEPARFVVMVGRHEDVADQKPGRGEVVFASGVPVVVVLFGASGVVRTDEKNPRL